MSSSRVPAGRTEGDSHHLRVWPGARNGLYIFKGLFKGKKRSDRDHMRPAKSKRFTLWPFPGNVCNLWEAGKGRALRASWERGLVVARSPAAVLPPEHQLPFPGLASPEGPPLQAWPLWRPHFPCPLHGPSEPVLPANTSSADKLLSQCSPHPPAQAGRCCSRPPPRTAPPPGPGHRAVWP